MKHQFPIALLFILTLCLAGCSKKEKPSYDKIGFSGLTERTENLKQHLPNLALDGTLFGQQNSTLSGIGWLADSLRSDVESVIGEFPAMTSYDISGIETGRLQSQIDISALRRDVKQNYDKGLLIRMEWSPSSQTRGDDEQFDKQMDRLADFLLSLRDDYGRLAPVLFVPYPKMLSSTAWYNRLSKDDYEDLFEDLQKALKHRDVANVVYCFSFEAETEGVGLADFCPDDDVSAIEARALETQKADSLSTRERINNGVMQAQKKAEEYSLALALYTGSRNLERPSFWLTDVLPVVKQHRLAYVLTGENRGEPFRGTFYTPYPGGRGASEFMRLYNSHALRFAKKLNGLYLK